MSIEETKMMLPVLTTTVWCNTALTLILFKERVVIASQLDSTSLIIPFMALDPQEISFCRAIEHQRRKAYHLFLYLCLDQLDHNNLLLTLLCTPVILQLCPVILLYRWSHKLTVESQFVEKWFFHIRTQNFVKTAALSATSARGRLLRILQPFSSHTMAKHKRAKQTSHGTLTKDPLAQWQTQINFKYLPYLPSHNPGP